MDYPFQIAYVQPLPQVSRFVQQEGKTRELLAKPLAATYDAHLLVWRTKPRAAQVELSDSLGENKTVLKIEFFMLCTSFHFGLGLELSVNF